MKKQNKVAFFNILSTMLLRGLSIITAPLFSRMLGPDGYGIVSIYTVWVSALQIAFTLQTQGTMANAKVEYDDEQRGKYHSSVLALSLLFFAVCSGVVLIFLDPVAAALKLPPMVVVLMLVHVITGYCVNFLHNKFVHEFRAGFNCFMSVLVALLTMALSLLFIMLLPPEMDYYGRIGGQVATYALVGIPACVYVLAKGKTFVSREYWRFCLPLCLPLVFYNLSDLILGYTDRLMLQRMMTDSMVGLYSLASAFGNIMFTIFTALNNSWVPFFFEDYKLGRQDQMRRQAKNFLELFTVLSMGFVLLTPEVYHVFAGEEFWPGTELVPVFVISFYLNFLCTFPVNIEYYYKKTKAVAAVTIGASLVNIVLNFFLIRSLGPMGAALSTAISHGVQLVLHYLYARFRLGRADYPFKIGLWGGYAAAFFGIVVFAWALSGAWFIRWAVGAVLGVWELLRIRRRKVLL